MRILFSPLCPLSSFWLDGAETGDSDETGFPIDLLHGALVGGDLIDEFDPHLLLARLVVNGMLDNELDLGRRDPVLEHAADLSEGDADDRSTDPQIG